MSSAVANSTPLMQLAVMGLFRLLRDSFDEIRIPPAVWRSLVEESPEGSGANAVEEAAKEGWLRVVAPNDEALVISLEHDLRASDAEAIALAVQEKPDAVLLGRAGVIGFLMQAKREGKVAALQDLLARLGDGPSRCPDEQLDPEALAAVGDADNWTT